MIANVFNERVIGVIVVCIGSGCLRVIGMFDFCVRSLETSFGLIIGVGKIIFG